MCTYINFDIPRSDDGVFLLEADALLGLAARYWRCSTDWRPTVWTKNRRMLSPLKVKEKIQLLMWRWVMRCYWQVTWSWAIKWLTLFFIKTILTFCINYVITFEYQHGNLKVKETIKPEGEIDSILWRTITLLYRTMKTRTTYRKQNNITWTKQDDGLLWTQNSTFRFHIWGNIKTSSDTISFSIWTLFLGAGQGAQVVMQETWRCNPFTIKKHNKNFSLLGYHTMLTRTYVLRL
jgi:hypothetical protein